MDDLPHDDLVGKCIKVMRGSQAAMNAKTAGLMCLYIQNPENATETRECFRSVFERLGAATEGTQAFCPASSRRDYMCCALPGIFGVRLCRSLRRPLISETRLRPPESRS